ncbi:DedA family protein [Bradyrhizobium cenepequi]|uniref:DedA family protein n=1 Tax=Bradyrhizobium cenepequi TaxID=2821403 RepID=UPI001CE32645|nr:DedA family protein [Bradyrhizobium cenepequi]MCA6112046.1 DedA family protein [Bradyrhizobium cenepequi]
MSLEESGRHVVEFVRDHRAWAAPIVFALAFAESLAFLSFVVPAWAVLVGIGAMMKSGGIAFLPVLVAGALGAALGDWLSFWIGGKFEHSIRRLWPFSQHPHLLVRGEAFIKKWGVLAIVIGRFSGPLRASVPIVAGMLRMPWQPFQIANFVSAFIWVAVLLQLGDVSALVWRWLREHVVQRF